MSGAVSSNTYVQVTELDFDLILTNLQNWFQTQQSTFTDYNYTGAGLGVLLRALAYNTHYGALLANILGTEMFPTTAQLRDNIITGAKSLNYTPASMSAPIAFVNITVTPPANTGAGSLVIPAYTQFVSTAINGTNYPFVTNQAWIANLSNGTYQFANVELLEGTVLNYTFTMTATNSSNTFNLPSANIDTTTLVVNVLENNSVPPTSYPYVLAGDVTLLDNTDRVYFLDGSTSNTYNLQFGDGVIGKALNNGDVINAIFISTDGELANYANNFAIQQPLSGYSNVIITAVSAASGGSQAEDNDSIQLNAPQFYVQQNRAVTVNDYESILLQNYPNISSCIAWGGDQNVPPVYGQVFISVKPQVGNYLTTTQKNYITNTIFANKGMVMGSVNIVDADFTYLNFSFNVYYNPNATVLTEAQIENEIQQAVYNYANNTLGLFNSTYIQNQLEDAVIAADASILGVDTTTFLQKTFYPTLGLQATYTLNYYTALAQAGILDALYSSPSFGIYDVTGVLQNCYFDENPATYTGISQINITNPGAGYTTAQVQIVGDGTGASATAVIVNGGIGAIIINDIGTGYSIATATILGDGYGAQLNCVLSSSQGTLEIYYYASSDKFYITQSAGTVDHTNGIVTLSNFNPQSIANPQGELSIYIQPQSSVIIPARNNIMLVNPNDPLAIAINMIPTIP